MQHKVDWGPGWRFFVCGDCGYEWDQATRHCESLSGEPCPVCGLWTFPHEYEKHYEWATDGNGNLIRE